MFRYICSRDMEEVAELIRLISVLVGRVAREELLLGN
jgi:hypothetical protein